MSLFRRNRSPQPPPAPVLPTKGVEIQYSDSHDDYFQRNLVAIRTVSSLSVGSYGLMYRRQPAVRTVVDFLSRNIAQLNAKVYERVSAADRLEVSQHPLAVLLRRPNPQTTRYNLQRATVADLAIHDRAYWRKFRTNGRVVAVDRIPPDVVNVDWSTGTKRYLDPQGREIARGDLVVFAGYSPDGDTDGTPPLETLRQILLEDAAATANRERMWHNAARQSGFIQRPLEAPEWSDKARERFRLDFEAMMTGERNSGRTGILEDGMTWNASAFSPEQTQYVEGRKLTHEEVALTYFGPFAARSYLESIGSATEEVHRQVYQDVLGPWLRMLQDEIELQLLGEFEPFTPPGTVYVEFNLQEKLKGSFEEQGRTLVTAVGVPYMTVNEGRARLNLPRIDSEWADEPVQPMNVMYGGQPAVTVPTEDPGTRALTGGVQTKAVKAPSAAAIGRRNRAIDEHLKLFRQHFDRQERSIAGKALGDKERWDRELGADLFLLAQTVAAESGHAAARQINGVFDEKRVRSWLAENARIVAELVNAKTFDALAAAGSADEVREVFELARAARAEQLATSRSTDLINFARTEAGRHSQDADGRERMKQWVVTSAKSRHPEMNGERVPVEEKFSNGLMWPGAAGGSADETANCHCLLILDD